MTRLIDADALAEMFKTQYECETCDNYDGVRCRACHCDDALGIIDSAPTIDAEWELFQRITDTYYDKQMFFLQDDGSVYDRMEAVYHSSTDAAIDAFIRRISEGEDDGKID